LIEKNVPHPAGSREGSAPKSALQWFYLIVKALWWIAKAAWLVYRLTAWLSGGVFSL
jgi:hypothetical protein